MRVPLSVKVVLERYNRCRRRLHPLQLTFDGSMAVAPPVDRRRISILFRLKYAGSRASAGTVSPSAMVSGMFQYGLKTTVVIALLKTGVWCAGLADLVNYQGHRRTQHDVLDLRGRRVQRGQCAEHPARRPDAPH